MYIYLSVCITRHDFNQILKHFSNVRLVNLWEKWYDILSSRHWQWWSVKNETLWQRDDLNFPIVNFPFICTCMQKFPAAPAYGVYISLGWSDIHRTSLLSLRNAVYPNYFPSLFVESRSLYFWMTTCSYLYYFWMTTCSYLYFIS
jgi:hypothetical protein